MTGAEYLRAVRKLGPISVRDLVDSTGGSLDSARNTLRDGVIAGLLTTQTVRRGRFWLYVWSATELGCADCECGAPKEIDLDACDRCLYLDGVDRQALIIDVLRGTDGLSLREICIELGMNSDIGNGQRDIWRHIQSLMAERRIRRYWHDDTTGTVVLESHRKGTTERHTARGCWAYVLDGKTEREWKKRAA